LFVMPFLPEFQQLSSFPTLFNEHFLFGALSRHIPVKCGCILASLGLLEPPLALALAVLTCMYYHYLHALYTSSVGFAKNIN
ncbi:hypothetical protein ACQP3F_30300, partial [Escherichia coli]